MCGFGAPFGFLGPKTQPRVEGGGPICQVDSENNWPVRPLMQFDVTHLRPKCYMAALGRNFPVNFGCQGGCHVPRRTPGCLVAAKLQREGQKKLSGGRHRNGEGEGARVHACARARVRTRVRASACARARAPSRERQRAEREREKERQRAQFCNTAPAHPL